MRSVQAQGRPARAAAAKASRVWQRITTPDDRLRAEASVGDMQAMRPSGGELSLEPSTVLSPEHSDDENEDPCSD